MTTTADILDRQVPLQCASHHDVQRYEVAVPMRYSECIAVLRDGRRVGLQDRRRFLGSTSDIVAKLMLFKGIDADISISCRPSAAPVVSWCKLRIDGRRGDLKSLVLPDGSLRTVAIAQQQALLPQTVLTRGLTAKAVESVGGVAQPA